MSHHSSHRPDSFSFIVTSAPGSLDPSVPIAASRAGAIGVLDLEFAPTPAEAASALATLVRLSRGAAGIRLAGADRDLARTTLRDLPSSIGAVVVDVPIIQALGAELAAVRAAGGRVYVEVLDLDGAEMAQSADADELIARGLEAGGFVGDVTTFILLQQLVARTKLPVWAHGGIGLHTAAACRAAGAAGVVLDLQLALVREAALPSAAQAAIRRMDGSETVCLGEDLGRPFRAFSHPRQPAVEELRRLAERLLDDSRPLASRLAEWETALRSRVGWGTDDLWPVGQDAAFADRLAQRFVTTGGVIAGIRDAVTDHLRIAARTTPLAEGAPLAQSHGTRYPILQGPMTRVSDTAAFAESVAAGGALPFLALALLRGPDVRTLLEETQRRLGARPWGVGILGFVPLELRQQQLDAIQEIRPPFALIAGGRPDQALALEQAGIHTYLHVPSPALLKMFVEGGARRFVFEGRECGGHVGPRSSFTLWNTMVDTLLDAVPSAEIAETCHVVFAGGVHDALSTAMVAALAAPLVERGFKIGVLLGTGYLFTGEACRDGAITATFQEQAIACRRTALLETGPGHSTRCVATPYVDAFQGERRRLRAEGKSHEEITAALEELNLGRLRIASKGIARKADGATNGSPYVTVNEDAQRRDGLYMIGQVAMLRDRVCTISELHADVADGSSARLAALAPASPTVDIVETARPADIAIIGMSCMMPKAPDLETYWSNILNKVDAITEIPLDRFDWRRYFDPDMRARDKIYSKWGGFLDPVPFDPARYGMPPSSLASIEPLQLLTLEAVRHALADAGYASRPFARQRTGIIVGVGGGVAELGQNYGLRSSLPMYFSDVPDEVLRALPEWTEDSFAGIINNVAAGRVANRFDFGGVNYAIDAACASSLAALYSGVRELETGNADVMVVAGSDTVQSPFGYLCFSKTRALSPNGRCRTFDEGADGIVISEGIAVVVLKRLADAERDGDRVYAVIKSVAGSSDGRDRSMTAPRPEGQMLALRRAYARAGIAPTTVGLIEAHGTGTVAGDQAETEALSRVFREAGDGRQWCAVGSVKSMIGHTKCAAGLAGLIKIAKAVYHKVLPPTLGVERPNSKARFPESPFYVNSEARPWITADETPRRAGVSSFGFGGTNFHAVIEEYVDRVPSAAGDPTLSAWPAELFLFAGQTPADVADELEAFSAGLTATAHEPLSVLAAKAWQRFAARRRNDTLAASIVAGSVDDLRQMSASTVSALRSGKETIEDRRGIHFTTSPLGRAGRIAFLFPGQGSQSPGMLGELALHFEEVREPFETATRTLHDRFPEPLSSYVFPPPAFSPEDERQHVDALKQTQVAQPALGAAGVGMARLLASLNVRPDAVAGHSYGELIALSAADVFDADTLYRLSEARGRSIVESARGELGTMAAVQAAEREVTQALDGAKDVWIANVNSPTQTVISGTREGIEGAIRRLESAGLTARPIPVSCAFHSPLIAEAGARFSEHLAATAFATPRIPVYSNVDARPYGAGADAVAQTLREHLLRPVRFREQIEAMYEDGCRLFVEVGPRNVLTSLAQQTLKGRQVLAVPSDAPGRGSLAQLLSMLGALAAHGIDVRLDRLFAGRATAVAAPAPLAPTTWMVTGGSARPLHAPVTSSPRPGPITPPPAIEARPAAPAPAAAPQPVATVPVPVAAARPSSRTPETRAPEIVTRTSSSPAPAATFLAPSDAGSAYALAPAPAAASKDATDVMVQFQQTMARFLETQRNVMLAYLGSAPGGEVVAVDVPAATPASVVERRRIERNPSSLSVRLVDARGAELHGTAVDMSVQGIRVRLGSAPGGAGPVRLQLLSPEGDASLTIVSVLVRTDGESHAFAFTNVTADDLARLDRLVRGLPAAPAATVIDVIDAEPVPSAAPVPAVPALSSVQTELLRVASERTGYPVEMLDLDAAIEADLGIDSIKRVEILGALRQGLPASAAESMQADMERFTRARTLRDIVNAVAKALEAHDAPAPVAAAPVPVATQPAGRIDPALVRAELLRVASERTGYPVEMLDLDAAIEADLGIDSIKRVEILGALRQALPAAVGERMQADMERFTRARTLRAILDAVVAEAPPAAVPAPEVVPVAAELTTAAPATNGKSSGANGTAHGKNGTAAATKAPATNGKATVDVSSVQTDLLRIASERTGYPVEMLELDAAMEADLGIDSIKRVEILGALRGTLPAHVAERMQEGMDSVVRAKTLRGVVSAIAGLLDGAAPVAAPAPTSNGERVHPARVEPEVIALPSPTPLPRFVPVAIERDAPGSRAERLDGVVLVTDDGDGIAMAVIAELVERGARPVILGAAREFEKISEGRYALSLADASQVAQLIDDVHQRYGRIAGLVHLAPLRADESIDGFDIDHWRRRLATDVKGLFHLARFAAADIRAARKGFVLAGLRLDGTFGTRSAGHYPGGGGVAGIVKTLAVEWTSTDCKVVDVADAGPTDLVAQRLLAELDAGDGEVEVGWHRDRRIVMRVRPAPLAGSGTAAPLTGDSVVLITGGARGITAVIAEELARRYRPTLILVGRHPLSREAESPATAHLTSLRELKAAVIAELSRDGARVTPVQVEVACANILREREIRTHLAAMQATGARVVYRALDVRDAQVFGRVVDDVYATYGRLDGVIHGAGVIEDKPLVAKPADSFDRVFDTKVDGAVALVRALRPDSLRFLVFFSSVAGRFGNAGQSDYVAANEVLNKLARHLATSWPCRVVAVGWGPWKGGGMVTDDVARAFRERGVGLVDPDEGRTAMIDELLADARDDAEIVLGRGPWERADFATGPSAEPGQLPMLHDATTRLTTDGRRETLCTLSVESHLYLNDHCLDGKPVLPAAGATELIAEAAQRAWPHLTLAALEDLRLMRGIVLPEGRTTVRVLIRPHDGGSETNLRAHVELFEADQSRPSYATTAVLVSERPLAPTVTLPRPGELSPFPMSVERAYDEWLFHGPRFQCLTAIDGISRSAMLATVRSSDVTECVRGSGRWIADPVVVDAGLQLVLLWARATFDVSALPARYGALRLFAPLEGRDLRCYLEFAPDSDANRVRADIYYTTAEGAVLALMEGFEAICSRPLNRLMGAAARVGGAPRV